MFDPQNSLCNTECLTYGNVQVTITEHFAECGKTLGQLLADLILQEAKNAAKITA